MPVEFIGFIGNHNASEITTRSGPVVDRDYIETVAHHGSCFSAAYPVG